MVSFQTNRHTVTLKKPPVIVPGEPGIAGSGRQAFCNGFVDTHVQQGIHHPRLRNGGAAANGKQQRVEGAAEGLSRHFFKS